MWNLLGPVLALALIVAMIVFVSTTTANKEIWKKMIPWFMRNNVDGLVLSKYVEEVKDDMPRLTGQGGRGRGPGGVPRVEYMSYNNHIIKMHSGKQEISFIVTKDQFEMIEKQKWYKVSYRKSTVFNVTEIDIPTNISKDFIDEYFEDEFNVNS